MKYVVIGASAAGTAAARQLRKQDADGEIVLLGQDPSIFSRCQLHLVATGRRTPEQAQFLQQGWDRQLGVETHLGIEVTALDPRERTVATMDGRIFDYERLLIATGSRTFLPPIPGLAGPGTYGLRNMADAEAIRNDLDSVANVIVIGAGLVGVELALELADCGKHVCLVEIAPHPLPLQLETETGALCAALIREAGIDLYSPDRVDGLERTSNGELVAVRLASGATLAADIAVCAAGVRANAEFAAEAGAETGRGIVIDAHCRTSLPDVYAAGDVTETEDVVVRRVMPSAIWPAAIRQGQVAAINMAGGDESLSRNTGMRASINLHRASVISLGAVAMAEEERWDRQVYRFTDSRGRHNMRVLFTEKDALRAAILWGDITNAGVYGEAIINGRDISKDHVFLTQLDGAKRGTEVLAVS